MEWSPRVSGSSRGQGRAVNSGMTPPATPGVIASAGVTGTDPIDPLRLPAGGTFVGYVGVEGGIPTYSTRSGSVISPVGTAATNRTNITTAFGAAADDTYVELAAGTFDIDTSFDLSNSRTELRGQVDANGVPTTILNFTGGGDRLIHLRTTGWDLTSVPAFTIRDISTPAASSLRGVTTVTLTAAPTGLVANQIMFVYTDQIFQSDTASSDFLGKELSQIVRVSSVSGNDVTFAPAINADYLTGTIHIAFRTLSASLKRSGLRNLKLTSAGNGQGHYVGFSGADECWAYNLVTIKVPAGAYHFYPYGSYRCEVRHCDVSVITGNSNSGYCINPIQSSQCLFEDNHFHDVPNVMPMFGMNGSSFSFNYAHDMSYAPTLEAWLSQGVFYHGGHNHYNLFEGNRHASDHNDSFGNATSRNNVYFRNRIPGWDANTVQGVPKSDNTKCFFNSVRMVNQTIVGNVLGTDGYHTGYDVTGDTNTEEFSDSVIYAQENAMVGLTRKGNYNYVNDAVPASEALAAGEALVPSYRYSSKPAFFGVCPWPPIDPANPTQSDNVESIPAGYRAVHGVDP
jgi:hypothetical protein